MVTNDKKYYVYEFRVIGTDDVVYVGRGTGSRHQDKRRNALFNDFIKDFPVKSHIVKDGLTFTEAADIEWDLVRQRKAEGHALIQFETPFDDDEMDEHDEMIASLRSRQFKPYIYTHPIFPKFYKIEIPTYDEVTLDDLMLTTFLHRGWIVKGYTDAEEQTIKNYLDQVGGRLYSGITKGCRSVIEFGALFYQRHQQLKNKGLKVFHSLDVLDFIRKHCP